MGGQKECEICFCPVGRQLWQWKIDGQGSL